MTLTGFIRLPLVLVSAEDRYTERSFFSWLSRAYESQIREQALLEVDPKMYLLENLWRADLLAETDAKFLADMHSVMQYTSR